MPFHGNRIFLIAIAIAVIVIIGVAVAASGGPRSPYNVPVGKPCLITVDAGIGVSHITVSNLNTGSTWTILPNELPASFNVTSGESLAFNASATVGYVFNVWRPNSGILDSHNPCVIKVVAPFTLAAQFKPEMQ